MSSFDTSRMSWTCSFGLSSRSVERRFDRWAYDSNTSNYAVINANKFPMTQTSILPT